VLPLPPVRAYFITHYLLFDLYLEAQSYRAGRTLIWFTHPGFDQQSAMAVAETLNRDSVVVYYIEQSGDAYWGRS